MRVLVVEDNEANRKLLRITLATAGHEAVEAADGLEALERLGAERFDAVISDILMPRMDGYRLCHEVRKTRKLRDIPIIIYSATYTSPADERLALKVGADRFVRKPASASEILAALAEVVRGAGLRPEPAPLDSEPAVLKEYSERLVRKLEEKNTELEAAREALEASERRYRELVDLAPIGIYRSTRDGRFVNVNAAYARLLGYDSLEEVLRLDLRRDIYFENADRERWIAKIESQGGAAASEVRLKRRDDSPVWVRQEARAIRGSSGAVEFFEDFVSDIHQRKRAEEALRQSEERFRRSFSVSPVAMCLSEAKTELVVDANERLARMLGYDREELIGHSAVDLGLWADPQERARVVADVESSVPIREREVRLRTKSGEIRHVLGSIEPLLVGKETVLLSVFQDITERKRAEEALRASESRYRTLFERNLAGVYRSTREGRILECNEAFARMFGYESRNEILGHAATDLYPEPQRRSEFLDAIDRTGVLSNYEGRYRRRDGSDLWTLENAALVPAETGGGTDIEGTVIDVTQRRELEEQLRLSQKMEAVGQLAGGVAHDFNNLLTAILGYAEILSSQVGERSPASESVAEIRKAGERAASLTRQLLAFSRRQVLEPKVLDLNALAENLEKMLGRLIGEDVELVTALDPGIGRVRADAGQLEQVILNLAVNARDAMPKGGTLTIETKDVELDEAYAREHISVRPGRYVMVAVSDTGLGMSVETKSRLFEPFFTTKGKGKGTGLGLATVYGIVKQSGGYIWVYSELNRGTSFKVYLPRVEGAVEAAPTRRVSERQAGGSETVLLVEDEPSVRTLSRRILESYGYTVIEASGAAQALEAARSYEGPIHLVLTDVVMPEMGGSELTPRVAELRPDVRVLFMSGYTDDAILRQGLIAEGGHFLQKPFTPEVLARKVREILDGEP